MRKRVVTFGEIMLRLSTPGHKRFVQSTAFNVTYGGGEANVAVSLANYGLNSVFVSKLPKHEIGQSALNYLRNYGVDVSYIVRGGDRLGIYFLESGASQRASKVIYDRAYSALTNIHEDEINWDVVFNKTDWFHWTGITPALGKNVKEILFKACKSAKRKGIRISCDLNFRKKLWSEKDAQATMKPLMKYVDVCIANEEDAQKSLGISAGDVDLENGRLSQDIYIDIAHSLKSKYQFDTVAITLRESYSASKNGWSAILLDDLDCRKVFHSKRYDIQIVDRVGGGDAFAGGLIYGMLNLNNTKDALEFAVAASCLKQTIPGDFNLVSVAEIHKLVQGSGSGRVER